MTTLEKIQHIIAEELGREDVAEDKPLEELGLDSLEFVFLMTAIGKEIGEIPEAQWAQMHTIGDIVKALQASSQELEARSYPTC
jgi:acyl carrier protein